MDIKFTGQHIDLTQAMKDHSAEKVGKLEKYLPKIVEAHVILKKEKQGFIAEVTVLAKNFRGFGEGQDKDNVFVAIDTAYSRVETQAKKHAEKAKSHHKTPESIPVGAGDVADPLAETGAYDDRKPAIVKTEDFALKPMSEVEASMQLQLSSDSFLVFSNAKTNKVNVIYKRDDGDHGLIEPEF